MFKSIFKGMAAVLLLAAAGQMIWAATVSSQSYTVDGKRGEVLCIPLKLVTTSAVAGINGELDYDSTLFSNPTIITGTGANYGTIALGNTVSAGKFKFVVYNDPVKAIDPSQPVAYFQVKVAPTVSQSQLAKLTFLTTASGAGDTTGVGLGASFAAFNVKLLSNGVQDWALYE